MPKTTIAVDDPATENEEAGREPSEKPIVDWEMARLEYETGLHSVSEMASKYQLTTQAIYARKKREGWHKSLNAAVRTKTQFLLAEEFVTGGNERKQDGRD